MTIPHQEIRTLLGTISAWWHDWRNARAALWQVERLDGEMSRVAHDVGLGVSELRTLAGKWPASTSLLSRRLAAVHLDEVRLARAEPAVLRDLQRVCTMCSDKQHCGHDLDRNASNPEWRGYCPNVETLDAMEIEGSPRRDHGVGR